VAGGRADCVTEQSLALRGGLVPVWLLLDRRSLLLDDDAAQRDGDFLYVNGLFLGEAKSENECRVGISG
jgi:hypothetical protein